MNCRLVIVELVEHYLADCPWYKSWIFRYDSESTQIKRSYPSSHFVRKFNVQSSARKVEV